MHGDKRFMSKATRAKDGIMSGRDDRAAAGMGKGEADEIDYLCIEQSDGEGIIGWFGAWLPLCTSVEPSLLNAAMFTSDLPSTIAR